MVRMQITDKGREAEPCQNRRSCNYPLAFFIIIAVGLLVLSTVKVATAANGYIGIGIGPMLDAKCNKETGCLNAPDIQNEGISRLFGGYKFNENFSIEGSYMYIEKAKVEETVYKDYFQSKVTGFELTPVGSLPVAKDLSIFLRGGLVFWSSDMTFKFSFGPRAGSGSKSATGTDLVIGAGAKYDFNNHFSARAEYTIYYI